MDKDNKDFDMFKELLNILADKSDKESESIEDKQAEQLADLVKKDKKMRSLVTQLTLHEAKFMTCLNKINGKSYTEMWNDETLRNAGFKSQDEGMQIALLRTETDARTLEIFYDFVLKEIGSLKAVNQAEAILNEEVDNDSNSR